MSFLSQPIAGTIGIDISDHILRAVFAIRKQHKLFIKRYAQLPLDSGIIQNGVIQDQEAVTKAVKKLIAHGIPNRSKTAVIGLPELHSYIGTILHDGKNIEKEIFRHVPFDKTEVTTDSLEYTPNIVGFAAVKTEIANQYWNVFSKAGLHIRALEIESQALARLYGQAYTKGEAIIVVDIGQGHTTFLVAQKERIDFTHTSKLISAERVTQAIAQNANITFEMAEQRKLFQPKDTYVLQATQKHAQEIATELQRFIHFHYEHPIETPSKGYRIILTGGGAQIPDIIQQIEQSIEMPVHLAGIPPKVRIPSSLKKRMHSYATAIGLSARAIDE